MYQGSRELADENAEDFGFDAKSIDVVLLTHAHLDHCGRLPLLYQRGFRGQVITTAATRELARLVLPDAARVHEEDAVHRPERAQHRADLQLSSPHYSLLDVQNTLDLFGRVEEYGVPIELDPNVRATFVDAGHILGSASILLELQEQGTRRTVLFSGDLGNAGRPILRPRPEPPAADVVVMETTYGDRSHRPIDTSVSELYSAIGLAFQRRGNIVIPTFALERAQEPLYFLRAGVDAARLPRDTQAYLDSPLAISVTQIFQRFPECCNADFNDLLRHGRDPLSWPGLHYTREKTDSAALNHLTSGAVIMAGAGMCTGGRVRYHLKYNLPRPESAIIFVGYAASGTLARRIIDGARVVDIFDEQVPVRASVHTINGFSAHADQGELLAWQTRTGAARTFLVHGEPETMRRFAALLPNTKVELPAPHQTFEL
jgi:metallo-beta-lactamase family protein